MVIAALAALALVQTALPFAPMPPRVFERLRPTSFSRDSQILAMQGSGPGMTRSQPRQQLERGVPPAIPDRQLFRYDVRFDRLTEVWTDVLGLDLRRGTIVSSDTIPVSETPRLLPAMVFELARTEATGSEVTIYDLFATSTDGKERRLVGRQFFATVDSPDGLKAAGAAFGYTVLCEFVKQRPAERRETV